MRLSINLPRIVITLMLVLAISSPVVHAFKVARISYELGAYVFYIGFPIITLIVWGCLLRSKHLAPSPFFFVLLFFLMLGTFVTIMNGGDEFDIAGNFLRLTFCVGMLQFAVVYSDETVSYLGANEKRIAGWAVGSMSVAIGGLYLASYMGFGVYFGLQSTLAFIGLSYGLVHRKAIFIVISIALIVLSGKRGAMLAGLLVVFAYLIFLLHSRQLKRFAIILSGMFLVTFIAYFAGLVPESILMRFEQFSSGGVPDWDKATAGRMTEVEEVLRLIDSRPLILVHGLGLGAAINMPGGVSDSTVHFSPLGLILMLGLPLTIVFYIAMFFYAAKGIYLAGHRKFLHRKSTLFWSLIFIGELAFSFSAFTILQSTVLWLSLAAIIALSKEYSGSRRGEFIMTSVSKA